MENIEKFNERGMDLMRGIAALTTQKKDLEAHETAMREDLIELFDQYGIQSIDNEFVKITRVKGSETLSIDLKKFEAAEPDTFAELVADYPKKTVRKPYVRISVK